MRATEFVNEEINPDILNTKFKHKQVIGDYTLSSKTVRLPTGPLMLQIKAFIGDKYIGKADFYIGVRSETLHSGLTTVAPAYKKQGVATAMYAYAKMLGNDIVPSVQQLAPGKKMWAAWKKSGEAKHLMPANESQTAKTGIMQTDVYGSRAYHARCLEPGCDWESRRYDRIQQAQAAAKKHAETHFGKKQGVAEDVLNFEAGHCPIFAIALHRLSKLPLMALIEYDEELESTVLIHAYVKLDEMWRIDATGKTTVDHIEDSYPNYGDTEEVEISEKDLLELGYGKNKCPTLQQVLPYAKKVLQKIEVDKQGVAEAFDQPYKIKWEKSEYGDVDALAKLQDGTSLSIMFNLADKLENNWGVEFYRNNSQAATGEGDAQRVFATVLAAIGQFLKKKKPNSLFFTAVKEEDPTGSRTKLYDRLVQRYATGLGYDLKKVDYPEQTGYKLTRQEQGVAENFADGRNPGRKGLAKRVGVNCKQPVSKLRKIAKNSSGEKQRMAHWCANMKSGRKK